MFGLGITEVIVVLIVALLVFGPKRLPEVARSLGKSMGELRRTLDDIKQDVNEISSPPPLTPAEAALEGTCEEANEPSSKSANDQPTSSVTTQSESEDEASSEPKREEEK